MPRGPSDKQTPIEQAMRKINELAPTAVNVIEQLMNSDDDRVSLRAAETILDRGGVSAKQQLQIEGQVNIHALDAELEPLIEDWLKRQRENAEMAHAEETGKRLLGAVVEDAIIEEAEVLEDLAEDEPAVADVIAAEEADVVADTVPESWIIDPSAA